MAAAYEILSVCECQALLSAELNEDKQVIAGWARPRIDAEPEPAPANTVDAAADRFDVVWQCPLCGRNSLRSFYQGALRAAASGS